MLLLVTILRLLHIVFGIFWVGAALLLTFFITPSVRATQDNGQKFFSHLMQKTSLSPLMLVSALITVVAGLVLYWIDSSGLTSAWVTSGPGTFFGLGGVAGLAGLTIGLMQNQRSKKLAILGKQIQSQGSPPNSEQAAELARLQKVMKNGGNWNAGFLLIAAILMSTARFMVF